MKIIRVKIKPGWNVLDDNLPRPIKWLLARILPRIRFSMHPPKMTGQQYHEALAVIRPGDIILTLDSAKLGAKITPGGLSRLAHKGRVFNVARAKVERPSC